MAAQAATSANAKHSSIVSDIRVIEFIYRAVQDAGRNAFDMEVGKNLPYYFAAIGSTSRTPQQRPFLTTYNKPPIAYISKDITVVGGAALNIYDSKLTGFKDRRKDEFKSLKEELNRETSDIDMVWWPREMNKKSGYLYTVDSPAVQSFIQSFIESLYGALDRLPRGLIPGLNNIEINPRVIPSIGVQFIEITFYINNNPYKIADLAIHDNGGSQQYDSSGNKINQLVSMYDDPIYCSSLQREEFSTTSFYNTRPSVPNLIWYVKQQLFAYGNFRTRGDREKMNIIQNRIEYLIKILRSYIRNHTDENKRNLTELFGDDKNYNKIVEHIIKLANEKGMELEEISENNILKMAEYSKKVLESNNAHQVKKYTNMMSDIRKMQQNNSNILVKNFVDLSNYFLQLINEIDQLLQVPKTNNMTNNVYQTKNKLLIILKEKYIPIYFDYVTRAKFYITELNRDPNNKEYKEQFNKLINEFEEMVVSVRNNINTFTSKNVYTHIAEMTKPAPVSSSNNATKKTRRRRKGKRDNTFKNKF